MAHHDPEPLTALAVGDWAQIPGVYLSQRPIRGRITYVNDRVVWVETLRALLPAVDQDWLRVLGREEAFQTIPIARGLCQRSQPTPEEEAAWLITRLSN